MEQVLRIVAVPDERTHPALLVTTLESVVRRESGVRALDSRMDVCAGEGESDVVVRIKAVVSTGCRMSAIEAALGAELGRYALEASLSVHLDAPRPSLASAAPESAANAYDEASSVRSDVRRLLHLVPRGRVTTVTALADWMAVEPPWIMAAFEMLDTERGLPWYRLTDDGGQIDTLLDGRRTHLHTALLEADRVPVRYARVVGFERHFIDVARL